MSEQPVSETATGTAACGLREYVSAAIAGVIVLGTVAMLILAFNYLSSPQEFDRIKDLLLFINPLLGVVIGYYFNKASSEPRAETAEAAAKTAVASAQQATESRDKAEAEAEEARGEAEEAMGKVEVVKTALKEVGEAAEKMAAAAPTPKTLSVDETTGRAVVEPRLEFEMAWKRAQSLVE
jgi:hypothetical protein